MSRKRDKPTVVSTVVSTCKDCPEFKADPAWRGRGICFRRFILPRVLDFLCEPDQPACDKGAAG